MTVPLLQTLPETIQDQLGKWIDSAIPPGPFLMAVLENDLSRAIANSRPGSKYDQILPSLLRYLQTSRDVPPPSWGSPEQCDLWCAYGGKQRAISEQGRRRLAQRLRRGGGRRDR